MVILGKDIRELLVREYLQKKGVRYPDSCILRSQARGNTNYFLIILQCRIKNFCEIILRGRQICLRSPPGTKNQHNKIVCVLIVFAVN